MIKKPTVTQRSQTVGQPVRGNIYIALEDGSLVPVTTSSNIQSIPPVTKTFSPKPRTVPLDQRPSTSRLSDQPTAISYNITKSIPLGPKFVKERQQKQLQLNTNNENTFSKNKLTSGKREADNIKAVDSKKFKTIDAILPDHLKLDYHELIKVENTVEITNGEDDQVSNTSFTGSAENEYTEPEYLYDELDEVNDCDEGTSVLTEESDDESELLNHVSLDISSTSVMDADNMSNEEEVLYQNKSTPKRTSLNVPVLTPQNSEKRSLQSNLPIKLASDGRKVTNTTPYSNKLLGAHNTNKSLTPKTPRINDKFPELPVPANINQYGDCLKTKLGRYHYGLTLNDPPCQFFRGVLKGASGQTLAVMFGDTNLLSKLEGISIDEVGHFAIDTTFRVLPNTTLGVNHVFTINLLLQNQIIPLWYAITSCSSPELYKRILIEFQQYVLDWPFFSILMNNDPALCKAVLAVFPDADMYGSWFHYCHSIWRELTLNNLGDQCRTDSTLMDAVKMLMVVPFLPPLSDTPSSITMLEGFEVVRQLTREGGLPEEFNNVLDYVVTYWFNQVKSKNFSVYGTHTRALNYVEVFQLSLLSYMKPEGNVWTLTSSFQSVAKSANTELSKYLSGKAFGVNKNRGKKLNVLMRLNMKKLMMGTYDVKTYLEKCTIYCEEMLDIFLHPLYPTITSEKSNYVHTEGWKVKIIDS